MRRIHRHDIVDSTNERAFASLAAGQAADGEVHLARSQEQGRGRLGRRWESAPGEGLYLSLIHLPPAPPPAPAVTMAAGVAVLETLAELGLGGARLDWPNDVVVGAVEEQGAKLAGILVESRSLDAGRPHFVVGIGVNVLQRRFSAELAAERPVTSLALEGVETGPEQLVDPLVAALTRRLGQAREEPTQLAAAFLAATDLAGRRVLVRTADRSHAGRLLGVDLERGLALEESQGAVRIELAHVHTVHPASV